ncbi:MAG: stage II sporulation protein M [Tissierellia bacterium]|jgi:stage II sporulation protein M|nr:stage II sporulation protein M [Tissierellia bacterium]
MQGIQLREGLREIQKTFIYSLVAFLAIAFFSGLALKKWEPFIQDFVQSFVEGKEDLFSIDGQLLALGLFKNNLKAAFYSFALGLIPFLFLPGFSIAINAVVIGAVYIFISSSLSVFTYILVLLPHGIFEIPAFLLAASSGIYFCRELTRKILRRPHGDVKQLLFRQAQVFVFLVVPLLVLAAFIESYISPLIMLRLMG